MRLLTGKDRREYEALLVKEAHNSGAAGELRGRVEELHKDLMRMHAEHDRERQRADTAMDALLSLHGIPPISPQPPMAPSGDFNPLAEDPEEAARIEKRMMEFGPAAVFQEMKA